MRIAVQRARRVIAVSESTRLDILRFLRADPAKVSVVYEGVGEQFFQPVSPAPRRAILDYYGLTDPFLLFVGERRPHKNLVGLVRAFEIFSRSVPTSYRLVVAGKRYADYQVPEQIVQESGLSECVLFIDDLPDAHLPALYQAADGFVLLSHYEGFGLPVLEAMASGAPVVASNRTALPEVVGEAGILVDPDRPEEVAAALNRLVSDEALREEKITAGRERARQFSWRKAAVKTIQVYEDAVDGLN